MGKSDEVIKRSTKCPACVSDQIERIGEKFKFKSRAANDQLGAVIVTFECRACGHTWTEVRAPA